jgi:hypothetical protein
MPLSALSFRFLIFVFSPNKLTSSAHTRLRCAPFNFGPSLLVGHF